MDLDNTEIVIRERTLAQRIDLSFHLIRRFAGSVLLYSLVGIAPFFALNIFLVQTLDTDGYWEYYAWYGKWMMIAVLTTWETPFAMAPLVVFLSQRIFRQRVRLGATIRKALGRFSRQLVLYFLIRLNFLPVLIVMALYIGNEVEPFMFFAICTLLWNAIFFAGRPYVDLIMLLEELGFRSKNDGPRLGTRSAALHRYQAGDLFGESLSLLCLNIVFFIGLYSVQLWGVYIFWQNTVTLNWFSWTFFAVALWGTQIFSTVFRFLGYLDTRVRLEGWELELRMKSEGAKVRRQMEHLGFHPESTGPTPARIQSGASS